ncbi:hypothetical protein D5086_014926, partial [Populus alba]
VSLFMQNVKAVFDAAIRVVLQPPKQKKKKSKAQKACSVFSWWLVIAASRFRFVIEVTRCCFFILCFPLSEMPNFFGFQHCAELKLHDAVLFEQGDEVMGQSFRTVSLGTKTCTAVNMLSTGR